MNNKKIKNLIMLQKIKKIVIILKNLDEIDMKLEKKYKEYEKEILFYKEISKESKNSFINIIKNLN